MSGHLRGQLGATSISTGHNPAKPPDPISEIVVFPIPFLPVHDRAPWAMLLQARSIHPVGQTGQARPQSRMAPNLVSASDYVQLFSNEAIGRGTDLLICFLDATDAGTASQPTRPGHINHHSASTGFQGPARYGPPSPLNMGNMGYSLPSPQSQRPFESHLMPQYSPAGHPQGMVYPMQSMGYYPGQNGGAGMPYGIPYAPAYSPYPLPQHPGSVQHGSGHYPPYVANPSMQSMGAGQGHVYGAGYYAPYAAPSGHGNSSAGQMQPQHRFPARQNSRESSTYIIARKDAERRIAGSEYDVSKTIVDGSNPSRLVQALSRDGMYFSPLTSSSRTMIADALDQHQQIRFPSLPPYRPLIHHAGHHASQNSLATRSGWATFLPEQT